MSVSDELMWSYYELLSSKGMDEIEKLRKGVAEGSLHPKAVKEELAREFVARYHGERAADEARAEFNKVHADGGVPADAPEGQCEAAQSDPVSVMAGFGLVKSRSEARRKLAEGGYYVDGEQVRDEKALLAPGTHVVRFGKKRFLKLTVR